MFCETRAIVTRWAEGRRMALATASVLQVPLRWLLWLGSLSLLNFAVDLMRQSYKSKSQQICFLVNSTADALGG